MKGGSQAARSLLHASSLQARADLLRYMLKMQAWHSSEEQRRSKTPPKGAPALEEGVRPLKHALMFLACRACGMSEGEASWQEFWGGLWGTYAPGDGVRYEKSVLRSAVKIAKYYYRKQWYAEGCTGPSVEQVSYLER